MWEIHRPNSSSERKETLLEAEAAAGEATGLDSCSHYFFRFLVSVLRAGA